MNKYKLSLVAMLTALVSLFSIAPATANSTSATCVTGGIYEKVTVSNSGVYLDAYGQYVSDNVVIKLLNANNSALDLDVDIFNGNGTRLWGITEYRDGDGKATFYPGDIKLIASPYVRVYCDKGAYWADDVVRPKVPA